MTMECGACGMQFAKWGAWRTHLMRIHRILA